jgi:phage terminase large subunit-like protein
VFDEIKAKRAVNFFEVLLTHTKGSYARKPFKLARWQEKIVRDVFGTVKADGNRIYQTVYIEIGKKNGKSELASGFALFGLIADGEAGAEIYSAASTRDQAGICYRVAAQMVRNKPWLKSRINIHDSTKVLTSKNDFCSFYKAISADADTQDGVEPHFAIIDELHRQKKRDLYDVLYRGMSNRRQPLFVQLTTAGVVGESEVCWEQHEYARQIIEGVFKDPSFYPVIYGLGENEDWQDEGHQAKYDRRGYCIAPATGWYKANPALGTYLKLEKVREEYHKAIRIPSEQNSFRRFRLSQWVSQEKRWIDQKEWKACGEPFNVADFVGQPCYAGLDLSTSRDITAYIKDFERDDIHHLVAHFWVPEEEIKRRLEQGDNRFDIWRKQGLITVTDGNVIDFRVIRQQIEQDSTIYEIKEVGHDPWNATEIVQNLADFGLTMVPIRQGFATMSPASKDFEKMILERRIRHGNNPVLNWMMDCVTIKQDPAGNIKPVKPDRLKSSKRIDGIVASIMAIDRSTRNSSNKKSIYDDPDVVIAL